MTNQEIAPLLAEMQRMQRRLDALEAGAKTGQLNNASITGASITVYADDGETPLQQIGLHPDGTVGASAMNGPVPPQASAPTLAPGQLSLTVTWDGTFLDVDGDPTTRPVDLLNVQVHVSTSSGFTPGSGTLQGTLAEAGSLVVQPLEVVAQYVQLVSVTTSAVSGDPSAEATATPLQVVATDLLDGIVTTLKLANDAVTEAKIAADAVTETQIADDAVTTPKLVAGAVETSKIAAGAVDAGTIAAGAVTTAKLDALAVTAGTIAANAVTTGKIDAGAVTAAKLETDLAVIGTIRSPNYDPGVAGWAVDGDGTAELNDAILRGDVAIGTTSGSQVLINTSPVFGSSASMQLPTNAAQEDRPPGIYSWVASPGAAYEYVVLTIESARIGTPADGEYMQLRLFSEGKNGVDPPELEIHHVDGAGVFHLVAQFGRDDIYLNPDIPGGSTTRLQGSDQTITNQATLQNSTDLNHAMVANATYDIETWAYFTSTATPVGANTLVKVDWDAPAGTAGKVGVLGATNTTAAYTSITNHAMRTGVIPAFGTDRTYHVLTGPQMIYERGILTTGGTAGTWRFRFAQNTAQAGISLTLAAGSFSRISRVA